MARRLRVPVRWLRAEAEAGRIPHLKAGKALLFDPETVETTLLERAKAAGSLASGASKTDAATEGKP